MYYFAYASNLNKQQMRERCPESKPLFTATLPNYKLVFTGWSRQLRGAKAGIRASRGEKVRGAVYEVTELCLNKLDRYESGYDRLNVLVFDGDGQSFEAVTYINRGQAEDGKPSADYLSVIQQGYRDWSLF